MAMLKLCFALLLLTCVLNAIESPYNRLRHEKTSPTYRKKRLSDLIRRRRASEAKIRRSAYYNPWTPPYLVRVPAAYQQSISFWQPQAQQIQRPYFIPIWGPPGKPPVYFPPQPFLVNPGFPTDNRLNNQYLPPGNGTDNSTVPTQNKFGEDGPVWGTVGGSSTTQKPTRRPRPPSASGGVTHPPLVRPTTPRAPIANEIAPSREPQVNSVPPPPTLANQPSRCVWAIISCCSASSNKISYGCFEDLGCAGSFWDSSPCDSDYARAAISTAMNYYQTR